MDPAFWRSFTLPAIDGIAARLDACAPSRMRVLLSALPKRAERSITRVEQQRVERSLELLTEREPSATFCGGRVSYIDMPSRAPIYTTEASPHQEDGRRHHAQTSNQAMQLTPTRCSLHTCHD